MASLDDLRRLLCALQDHLRDRLIAARAAAAEGELAAVAAVTAADTIYAVDRISEAVITEWFERHWPATEPVEVVMEGVEEDHPLTFPRGTPVGTTRWKCLIDPIDGTRALMYDKRPAWALAGLAPQRGRDTRLPDLVVAAMTELPISKQARADQASAVRGGGVVAESVDLVRGGRAPRRLRPSQADDFRHGFASFARFFPEGKALTAQIEEALWDRLFGLGRQTTPLVFEDQYIATGGQIWELLCGHDRMIVDARPLVFRKLGYALPLVCHPYDIATALILQEAGGVVEQPDGRPLDAPLDTTSPVAWAGYANPRLAALARPVLADLLREYL